MEARVELACSGDPTRTSCTHERTCVRAANAVTNWASQTDRNCVWNRLRTLGFVEQPRQQLGLLMQVSQYHVDSHESPGWGWPSFRSAFTNVWLMNGDAGCYGTVPGMLNVVFRWIPMNMHITRTVSCCFTVPRQIRSISRSVSQPVVQSLIVSLVAFYDRRALSLSLPLGRGTAFRSHLRHQSPFRFSGRIWRQFYLLAPSRRSNTFLRVILSPCFILQFYVFSIMRFSLWWYYVPWSADVTPR